MRTLLVPVPDESAVAELAVDLVEHEAVELLELCGGFTTADVARVTAAVAGRVPVGHVGYAVESIDGAAAYKARFSASG